MDEFGLGRVAEQPPLPVQAREHDPAPETMRLALEAHVPRPSTVVPDYPAELERIEEETGERQHTLFCGRLPDFPSSYCAHHRAISRGGIECEEAA